MGSRHLHKVLASGQAWVKQWDFKSFFATWLRKELKVVESPQSHAGQVFYKTYIFLCSKGVKRILMWRLPLVNHERLRDKKMQAPASPASPKVTLPTFFVGRGDYDDGPRLPLALTLTNQKTPGTLTKGAHRVPNSALKDTSTKLSFAGAVNHFRCRQGTSVKLGYCSQSLHGCTHLLAHTNTHACACSMHTCVPACLCKRVRAKFKHK